MHALHARYPAVTAAPGGGAGAGVLLLPLRCAAPPPGSRFGALLVHCAHQEKLATLVCAFIERRAARGAVRVRAGLGGDVLEFDDAAALDGPVGTALEAALEALSMRRCDRLLLADDGAGARFVEERPVPPPAAEAGAAAVGRTPLTLLLQPRDLGDLRALDSSLEACSPAQLDSMAALLAGVLAPFALAPFSVDAGGAALAVTPVYLPQPAGAPRPSAGFALLARATLTYLLHHCGVRPAELRVVVTAADRHCCDGLLDWLDDMVGTAGWSGRMPATGQADIVLVWPGAALDAAALPANCIVLDLARVLDSGPSSCAHRRLDVLYIDRVDASLDGTAIAPGAGLPGGAILAALLEALLGLPDEPLARGAGLRIDQVHGVRGPLTAPEWRAFARARDTCHHSHHSHHVHHGDHGGHGGGDARNSGATLAVAPLNLPARDGGDGLCATIFSPAHLASGARLIDPHSGASVDYRQLAARVARLAAWLDLRGLRPGDRVALMGCDSIAAVALMLACFARALVFAPINHQAGRANVASMLQTIRPDLVLADPAQAQQHAEALTDWQQCPLATLLRLAAPGQPADDADDDAADDTLRRALGTAPPDSPAVMLFTSGSTGKPKAVLHTHADLIACYTNYAPFVLELSARDTVYCASRMFFAYGLNNLVMALYAGASHVLAAPPEGRTMLELIAEHAVTVWMAVPALFKRALEPQATAAAPALRLCVSAGETLPAALYHALRARLGVPVLDGIGTTEVISTFISNRPGDARPGCTGMLVPGFAVKLINAQGAACQVGEAGTLWVKGSTVVAGYLDGTGLNEHIFVNGWFNTGDQFFMDASCRFYHVGRSGSTLKINGCWFSLQAMERTLLLHPAVHECAVCVIKDDAGLARPSAFVVLAEAYRRAAADTLWQELRRWAKDALGKDHYPHHFTALEALPRTASGKVMKDALASGRPGGVALP
ncbi:AMP-binding protein [Rugamonas sp. CCM 8940]|uniref:AMP-binding protein n=1 Tax=Rugamonas sp. CCM 8940 TaxID=2765359 RepID=UPI0018F3982F|nr:AMP-binding protein [Rugamonas sp. CCM 8940]MBJ7308882.1 AMP-binding protein [Rugamonas sp. CCM 8940]